MNKETYIFKRYGSSKAILEGMEGSKQEMIDKGLWRDDITFEEWSSWAGSHVEIKETT